MFKIKNAIYCKFLLIGQFKIIQLNISIFTKDLIDLFYLFPLKVSGSILDVYSGEQEISPVNMGLTSASCPSSLPMKREITGNVAFIVFLKKKKTAL